MNQRDRKEIDSILVQLRQAHERIDYMADAEQDKFDNLPEGLQMGERGCAIEQCADDLSNIRYELETLIGELECISHS